MELRDRVACFACGGGNLVLAVNQKHMLPVLACRNCGFYCTTFANAEYRDILRQERAEHPTEIPYES